MLVVAPCLFVWFWVAVPFPARDATPDTGGGGDKWEEERRVIEPNFAFFLFYYYGPSRPFFLFS